MLNISKITQYKNNYITTKVATLKSQNLSSGNFFNLQNINQISFGSKNPYNSLEFSEYLDEDFYLGKKITNDSIAKMVLDKLFKCGNIDDMAAVCANIQGYEHYDGAHTYFVDLRKDMHEYAVELLKTNGKEKELKTFEEKFNSLEKSVQETTSPRINFPRYVKKPTVEASVALGILDTQSAIKGYDSDNKKSFYNSYEMKMDKRNRLDEKREEIKNQLRPFVARIGSAQREEPVIFPNCIMLTGDNWYVAQDALGWLYRSTANTANFVEIERDRDSNMLQDKVITALEEAEENYQETGKRSIIFVDRFDRLLNPKYNTKENIASIKEYMNTADEDFHSTIVFYTPEGYIESLDRGTIQPHRVGLTVKLPISDDDLNLE